MSPKKTKNNPKQELLAEIVGWTGVISYVCAYLLLVLGIFSDTSLLFHIMYLVGAVGIIYHSYIKHDLQPVIVNVFFGTIAILAMAKLAGL